MSFQSDLHASQQIVNLLEKAKSESEDALDVLPGIYAVIESTGKILKGNVNLAELFKEDHENLLALDFSTLFTSSNWTIFENHIQQLLDGTKTDTGFEADLNSPNGSTYNYTWSLRCRSTTGINLITVIGRDVTEFKGLVKTTARMELELSTAKVIQDTLLPPPTATYGKSEVRGFYEPASECGGDWWYHCLIGQKLFLWIGDVTGHGVPAALVTSAARSAVSVLEKVENIGPSKALNELGRAIFDMAKGSKYMTFFCVAVDLESGDCRYARAGHEPVYRISPSKAGVLQDFDCLIGAPTRPLGYSRETKYQEFQIPLKYGDRLVFYTDGIYDVRNPEGEIFGANRFVRKLKGAAKRNLDTKAFVEFVIDGFNEFRKDALLDDDVTFFTFQFLK